MENFNLYEECWKRLENKIESLKKNDCIETTTYYASGKKYKNVKKRYCYALSMDDILNLMSEIVYEVRQEYE